MADNHKPDFTLELGNGVLAQINLKTKSGEPIPERAVPRYLLQILNKLEQVADGQCLVKFVRLNDYCILEYADKVASFKGEYEIVLLEALFKNPRERLSEKKIFELFKANRSLRDAEVYDETLKRQVRSTVERINKKSSSDLKKDLKILIYSRGEVYLNEFCFA